MDIFEKAKLYAANCHASVNQTYDGHPYTLHLNIGDEAVDKFIHLIPKEDQMMVKAAFQTHDVIEDTRQTHSDVKKALNERIADLAYALTNEKGKTRKERANAKYYKGIRNTEYATFLKVCDRIANLRYSMLTNSSMASKYAAEHDMFKKSLKVTFLKWMFTKEGLCSIVWALFLPLLFIPGFYHKYPITCIYAIICNCALFYVNITQYLIYMDEYKEMFDYMDGMIKYYHRPLKNIIENMALSPEERLSVLKEAKGPDWYDDNWAPYCTQSIASCNSGSFRMKRTDYGFCCKNCGNQIGFNLIRLVESPLNKQEILKYIHK